MKTAKAVTIVAAGVLLIASRRASAAQIEAAAGDMGTFDGQNIMDTAGSLMNRLTEGSADVDAETGARNVVAFLRVIRLAEGTEGQGGYRTCYGYSHTIADLRDHPAVTKEWTGVVLSDTMCKKAGFGPGCKSTAAGAYQIRKPTWVSVRDKLDLPDFGPESQDRAAIELIRQRGALETVKAGKFSEAVARVKNEWASLPGNYAGQGQRSMSELAAWYTQAGGNIA